MRFKMITEHKNVIGQSRAFDGAILYIPIKITEKVSDTYIFTLVQHSHRCDQCEVVYSCRDRSSLLIASDQQMVPALIFISH